MAGELTEVPELVGERRPDLVLVNDDDLTYAKVRLDDESLHTLVAHIAQLRDPLTRLTTAWINRRRVNESLKIAEERLLPDEQIFLDSIIATFPIEAEGKERAHLASLVNPPEPSALGASPAVHAPPFEGNRAAAPSDGGGATPERDLGSSW